MDRTMKLNLPQPFSQDYESEFEKNLFFAINLLRNDPKGFEREVDLAFKQMEELSNPETKKGIVELLKKTAPMGALKFDDNANKACRITNDAHISNEEQEPAPGGVLVRYTEIVG